MFNVKIYTDGACSGNPGNGGWGVCLIYNNIEKKISGAEKDTTNNRMELTAAIKGLEALKTMCNVELYSDSAYMVNAFLEGWVEKWQTNGFKGADKKDVKNVDLWQRLYALTKQHNVTFIKVKGHSDNKYNNECDKMAVNAIKTLEDAN